MKLETPNIVLITADSLRADYCGFISKKSSLTPFIDKIAKDGMIFEQTYSTAPFTALSFPSIMTGKYPTFMQSPLLGSRISISEYLRRIGYITIGVISPNPPARFFSGNGRGFVIFREICDSHSTKSENNVHSLLRGNPSISDTLDKMLKVVHQKMFKDSYSFWPRLGGYMYLYIKEKIKGSAEISPEIYYPNADHQVIRCVIRLLKKLKSEFNRPIFLWLHLMSTHYPYGVPYNGSFPGLLEFLKYQKRKLLLLNILKEQCKKANFLPDHKTIEVAKIGYTEGVRALDNIIHIFFDEAEDIRILEDSIIFFTADHGEELFEHGEFGHRPKLYNEVLKVPLFIWGIDDKRRIKRCVSTLDIFPTIIELTMQKSKKISSRILSLLDGISLLNIDKKYLEQRILLSEVVPGNYLEMITGHCKKINIKDPESVYSIRGTKGTGEYLILRIRMPEKIDLVESRASDSCRINIENAIRNRFKEITNIEIRDKWQDLVFRTIRKIYKI